MGSNPSETVGGKKVKCNDSSYHNNDESLFELHTSVMYHVSHWWKT